MWKVSEEPDVFIFRTEQGDSHFLEKVCKFLPNCTAAHPITVIFTVTNLRLLQITQTVFSQPTYFTRTTSLYLSYSFSRPQMALQSNAALRLLHALLPVSSVFLTSLSSFLISHLLISVCTQFKPHLINPSPLPRSIPPSLPVPRPHFRFPKSAFFTMTGCRPVAQPPNWKASPTYL